MYLLPILTSQYPCVRIHTEVQGEAKAESQAQQSQDQHHSTPGWALPQAVSEMIIHLIASYNNGLHTNHKSSWVRMISWIYIYIYWIDFDVKICKLYSSWYFHVLYFCSSMSPTISHVKGEKKRHTGFSDFSVHSPNYFCFYAYCVLFIHVYHLYIYTPYFFFSLSQWPLHGPMASAETHCGASPASHSPV